MILLGLDVGSSSVKAGILRNGKLVGRVVRERFPTHYDGTRAEVDPDAILKAVRAAIAMLSQVKRVDAVAMSVMAPSWIALDAKGKPLTPVVTHQDRRSTAEASELIAAPGKHRLLDLSGNLPFPGGISSTTC